jgi:hypothetical protein
MDKNARNEKLALKIVEQHYHYINRGQLFIPSKRPLPMAGLHPNKAQHLEL